VTACVVPAPAALKPGDVLAVRTGGFASELIRVGEELSGKAGLDNHIAVAGRGRQRRFVDYVTCTECDQAKPRSEFYERKQADGTPIAPTRCKDCHRAARKRWYDKNREAIIAKQHEFYLANRDQEIARMKKRADRRRDEVLNAYGGQCACCGETRRMFLTIDHVNNDGAEHRRQIGGKSATRILRWLCENGYPPGFQVLCWNCNHAKHLNGGVCPHQEEGSGDFTPPGPLPEACPDCEYRSSGRGVAVHWAKIHRKRESA